MQLVRGSSNFDKSVVTCTSVIGEENIQNEESPHKCHSIQEYHIPTFFNKDFGGIHKLLKFYNKSATLELNNSVQSPRFNINIPL